jgi:hypothetical protein
MSSVTGLAVEPDCAIKEDPVWYTCAKDQDCSYVYGACHNPVAIASKYKTPAGGFHACEAMRANCASTESSKQKVVVRCVSKKCEIAKSASAKPSVPSSDSAFFAKYDFSEALKPKTKFLGFIEPNYQRLKIEFQSVKKSKRNSIYLVNGVTQVKGNQCAFAGRISFEKIERKPTDQMHLGVDDELKNSGIQAQGQLTGKYEFKADPKPRLCGAFKGTMHLNYYIDRLGKFRYDDIEASYSDSFDNNQ